MPNQLKVFDELQFLGSSRCRGNVKGPMIPKLKIFDEGFFADAAENDWSEGESYGGTVAHAAVDGGAETITLGGTDEDQGELSHTAQWSCASNCGMLAKLKISAITEVCVTVGFADAAEATNDHVAGEIDSAAYRNMTTTADWAGFTFDTDQTSDVWYYGASNNGTEGTPAAAVGSLAPVADTYFYVAVQTYDDGKVDFYYGTTIDNLVKVGGLVADSIADSSTDLLTPYVGFLAHTDVALVCTVSRIVVWQDN